MLKSRVEKEMNKYTIRYKKKKKGKRYFTDQLAVKVWL